MTSQTKISATDWIQKSSHLILDMMPQAVALALDTCTQAATRHIVEQIKTDQTTLIDVVIGNDVETGTQLQTQIGKQTARKILDLHKTIDANLSTDFSMKTAFRIGWAIDKIANHGGAE